MSAALILPNGREVNRPSWWKDQAQVDARRADLASRYFVVKISGNDGVGEVWRCKRCRGRHPYLTASCQMRPFSGLDGAIMAITRAAGALAGAQGYGAVSPLVREVMALPDLATAHPDLARRRVANAALSAYDVEMSGIVLGRIEEIPKTYAQKCLDRVNQSRQSAAKIAVEGLEVR